MSAHGRPRMPEYPEAARGEEDVWKVSQGVMGDYLYQADIHKWQWFMAFVGTLILCALEFVAIVVLAFSTKTVPYIVEVESGKNVRLVGEVLSQEWTLSDSILESKLRTYVTNLRQIPSDTEVFKAQMLHLSANTSQAGKMSLERLHKKDDPFELVGVERRFVRVDSVQCKGKKSLEGQCNPGEVWRVTWREEVLGMDGRKSGEERFLGEFIFEIKRPETTEDIVSNPLGARIDHIHIDPLAGSAK